MDLPLPPPHAKTWLLLDHDRQAVERLAGALGVAPIVAQLLLNRGQNAPDLARGFLDAPLAGLHAPDLLPGITQAADRILKAIQEGKSLCVYGDYDVDGVTGTAILVQGLQLLHARVDLYVPHRLEEGYGLNHEALGQIRRNGVDVVITVDCGIASVAEAEEARRLGLELIITDHHEFKERLPDASVLVHPRLPGTAYPFGYLSGAAVAFKLAWALAQRASGGARVLPHFREYLLDCVALAALGVVADVVPLREENRILVRHGLRRLQESPLPGLQALYRSAGLAEGAELRASDIAFRIAPRLNAAGRLGSARRVIELLTTTQAEVAVELAGFLEEENLKRQTLEHLMVDQARQTIMDEDRGDDPALVLARPGWHPGIIGIVAGRLADQYGRPSIMIALPAAGQNGALGRDSTLAGLGVGSGRSVPGFALSEALKACGDLLHGHGGHQAAAGLRIVPERIDVFRERFCQLAAKQFPAGPKVPVLVLDAETPLAVLTPGLVRAIDRLEPYGADNRRPLFLAGDLQVVGEPRKVGKTERHLSFQVRQNDVTLKAIAFNMAGRTEELLSEGGRCCLAFTPKLNIWRGRVSVDLEVADIQAVPVARLG